MSTTIDAPSQTIPPLNNTGPAVFINPYSTVAVRSHVPVVLEMKNPNYSKWSSFFKTMCGKFGMSSHLNTASTADTTDIAWVQADCAVKSWIQCSCHDDVLDLAMEGDDQTTADLWKAVSGLFQENKESRAIYFHEQFHSLVQGDQTITEYSTCVKPAATTLSDVGHPLKESQLVLNLLRGLNPRFSNTADHIAEVSPFLNFARVVSQLRLKELRLANEAKVSQNQALIVGASSCSSQGCRAQAPYPAPNSQPAAQGNRGNQKHSGRNKSRPGGRGGSSQHAALPPGPWICINPQAFQ
jgi:hypothetical protein